MTSDHHLEMAYLFGDEGYLDYLFGDREVNSFDRCLAQFLILDTTAMAAFIFAALCLLSIIAGSMRVILRCVHSVPGFLAGTHRSATMGARLAHLLERFTAYYRPGDQLGRRAATLRIISTLLAVAGAYAVLLKPAILYLCGFIGGWTIEHGQLTVFCVNTFGRLIDVGVTGLTEWHQTCTCFGEEDGISWHAWLQDWYISPIDSDINHLPGIICALAGLIFNAWLFAMYFVAVWMTRSPSEPDDMVTILHYQSILGQYPGLVDRSMSIIRELVDALEHCKEELARRSDALRIKEEMLVDRDEAVIASQTECASLRDQVLIRERQLAATESSLADAKAVLGCGVNRESAIECDSSESSYR
jgi:hypothetical protein